MLNEIRHFYNTICVVKSVARPNNPAIYQALEGSVYMPNADTALTGELNEWQPVITAMFGVMHNRLQAGGDITVLSEPYWLNGTKYDMHDVFNTSIQFFDDHTAPLPETTLVPDNDIQIYIERVRQTDRKLTIPEQFEILLDITDGHIVGACHLGMAASRIMARHLDKRAYPGILVSPEAMIDWNTRVAQFEDAGQVTGDGPGDTYYFWTHAFASLVFSLDGSLKAKMMDEVFKHGTDIMVLTRRHIARIPTNTSHQAASEMGRDAGLALANVFAKCTS